MIKETINILLNTTVKETPAWQIAVGLLIIFIAGLITGVVINATIIFKIG